jgi:stage II sporulation protein AA (anti-sigma F factor antagonist)
MAIDQPVATGQFSIVRLPDEVDLAASSEVVDRLLSTINRLGPHLVVDARDVRFMDSSGLNALVRARERAEAMGGSLHLVAAGRRMRRLLHITRLERTLHRVDTIDAALACLTSGSGTHTCDLPAAPV